MENFYAVTAAIKNTIKKHMLCIMALLVTQSVVAQTTPPGNALNFDGVNDYVAVPPATINNLTTGTFETWVYLRSNVEGTILIKQSENVGTEAALTLGYYVSTNSAPVTGVAGTIYYRSQNAGSLLTSNTKLQAGQWYHIALAFTSTSAVLYINGIADVTVTGGNFVVPDVLTSGYAINTTIGTWFTSNTPQQRLNGSLDELRVFNTNRSASISADMLNTIPATTTGLLAYYKFDQGTAGGDNTAITSLADSSSAATNNGTLNNFSLSGATSNFVESYAMVVPAVAAATDMQAYSFTANWGAPALGTATGYLLDVSASQTFSSFVSGFNGVAVTGTSASVTGLSAGTTYCYRVRANKTSVNGQGCYSASNVATTAATGIASFTPTSAGPGDTVTITGSNLTGATAVSFGGVAAASFKVVNATTVTAVVSSSGSSGLVSVTTPAQMVSAPGFTYIPKQAAVIVITGALAVCPGGSTSLTAAGQAGANFAWYSDSLGQNLISNLATYNTPALTAATNYYVLQIVGGMASPLQKVAVAVNSTPTVSAGNNIYDCPGSAVTLTATGASSYSWQPGNLATASISVTPFTTTTYTVTGTAVATGCSSTSQVTVTVSSVSVAPAAQTICAGQPATLSVSGADNYTWQPGNISGPSITVSPTATTTYTVTGQDTASGCTTTASSTVTVNATPAVGVSQPVIIAGGSSTTLTATGGGSYAWSNASQSASTVVIPNVTTAYTVTVTNSAGCWDTASVTITVVTAPFTTGSLYICSGSNTTLTASGLTGASFAWYADSLGNNLLSNTAVYTTAALTANTNYYVRQTYNGVTGPMYSAQVLVSSIPGAATPQNVVATPATICNGQSSNLSAMVDTTTGQRVYWYDSAVGGNLLSIAQSGGGFTVSPTSTTTYYAQSQPQTDTVLFPYTGAVQTFTVPAGVTSIQVDARGASGGDIYNRTGTGGLGGRVQATMAVQPGQVLYVYVGQAGQSAAGGFLCNPCVNTSFAFNGGGAASQGTDASGDNGGGGGATDIRVNGQLLANRVLVAGGGGGANMALYESYNGGAGGGLTGADGQIGSFVHGYSGAGGSQTAGGGGTAGTGSLGYGGNAGSHGGYWGGAGGGGYYGGGGAISDGSSGGGGGGGSSYTNPALCQNVVHTQGFQSTNGGLYIFYNVQANCATTARQAVTVKVDTVPAVTAGTNTATCAGTGVTLTANGADTYSWQPGGLTGNSVFVTPNSTTTYTVTGTKANGGCSSTSQVTVSVASTTASAAQVICSGQTATLAASGASSYTWQPGNLSGPSLNVSPSVTTIYTVTGSNSSGCSTTANDTVTVNQSPVVSAGPGITVSAGSSVTLTATGANNYSWSSPYSSNSSSITFTPSASSTWVVTGTSVATGCANTASVVVTVTQVASITGNTVVCAGGTTTLTAAGSAPFSWYGSQSGRAVLYTGAAFTTPAINSDTTYWVADNTGTRVPVSITIAQPLQYTALPAIICPGGTGSLLINGNPQAVSWYTAAQGGSLLGATNNGSPFMVAPTANTVYYAQVLGAAPVADTVSFPYSGAVQTFTVPAGVTSIQVDARGARGGDLYNRTGTGGLGGRVQATMAVQPGQVLYVYVGQAGQSAAGGFLCNPCVNTSFAFNGGGAASQGTDASGDNGGGGGATDIRVNGQLLANRVLVAGGGGGANMALYESYNGGAGGGLTGADGQIGSFVHGYSGAGGSQTAGGGGTAGTGSLGYGGNAGSHGGYWGGAGGGGYYGGGGAISDGSSGGGGGGGSSYTNPTLCQNVVHTQGFQSTNGGLYIIYNNARACTMNFTVADTVKVLRATASNTALTICSSYLPYTWNGSVFDSAGTYLVHLTNTAGCDSAATLVLTVNQSAPGSITAVTVNYQQLPYTWNGNGYTASGTYRIHFPSASACDSLATLVLTVALQAVPSSGPAGTTVSIAGSGFTGATAVSFGGVPALAFAVVNNSLIKAVVGTGGATGDIVVTTPAGADTIAAGFTFTTLALPGNALSFNGNNVVINNPLAGALNYTIEYWIRTTQTGGNGQWYNGNGIVDGDIGGAANDFGTSLLGSKLAFGTGNPSYPIGDVTIVSRSNVNTGRWVFVAASRNATTGLMKLYINGVAEDSVFAGTGPLATNSTITLGQHNGGGNAFKGSIDEVRIFTTDRTASILADMADTLNRATPGIAAYYNFDEGTAGGNNANITTLVDISANNVNAPLNNFALAGSTSNWVESYAMVVPGIAAATNVNGKSFTANWTAPAVGMYDNGYQLFVATDPAFANTVTGYNGKAVSGTSGVASGLLGLTKYYYRVAADKSSVTGQGSYSATDSITTLVLPVISSFTPQVAPTGTTITIKGSHFTGATAVNFGPTPAASFSIVSDTVITAVVAGGSSGNIGVIGLWDTGFSTTPFTYFMPVAVSSVSPSTAWTGVPVTIHGAGFTGATAISLGGTPAISFTVISDSVITAVVGLGSTGGVTVTSVGGANTLAAAFTYTALPPPGNALSFDGVNDKIVIANPLAGASNYTIEYWMRTTQTSGGASAWYNGNGIVDGDIGGPANDFGTSLLGSKLAFGTGNPSSAGDVTIVSQSNVNTGRWVFVAATRNAATGLMKLYINGVAEDSTVAGMAPLALTSTVTIGVNNGGGNFFQGTLDEIRLFNTDRSANILADMGDTVNRTTAGLTAYYNFDEGIAGGSNTNFTPLFDISPNNVTATLNNFALAGSTSNWVESYAMVVPTVAAATNVTGTGFTANWSAPAIGTVNNYLLDVSASQDFSTLVAGYSALAVSGTSQNVTGLNSTTKYWYRVRADKTSATGQGGYSAGTSATTLALPAISSFTPVAGVTGVTVTIEGLHLSGTTAVSFGGTPSASFNIVSDTVITAVIAGGSTGNIVVSIPAGSAMSATAFTYIPPAAVSSFSPATGATGTIVTINGAGFTGSTAVSFGGTAATSFTIVSNNTMIAVVGNGATGNIAITAAGSTTASASQFTYIPHASVSSFSPASGITGTIVTIKGVNFTGTTAVSFGGTAAASFAVVNDSVIMAVVGIGATGNITVTTPNSAGSSAPVFTYIPPLAIYAVSPSSTNIFGTVAINGAGFTGATAITFGGVNVASFTVVSDVVITAVVGNGATGDVTVTARGTTVTLPAAFTLTTLAPPGNALNFDGVDDNIVIANPLAGATNYTIEFWMRTTQTNGGNGAWYNGNGIVDGDKSGGANDLGTSLLGTKLAFGTGNPSSVGDVTIVSNSNVNTGKWVFVAATRNASTGLMKLYINGVAEASAAAGTAPLAGNATITMGGANTGGHNFQGTIDEVRIFNTDRSAYIQADMGNTISRTTPGLVTYYNFDEGSAGGANTGGALLYGQTPNNLAETLNNFALTGSTSNWVESYAMVAPTANTATNLITTGFTANWAAPAVGTVDNYILYVATDSNFNNLVSGYNGLAVSGTSQAVTGLTPSTLYYYRVQANKVSVTGQGAYSANINVFTDGPPLITSFTPTLAPNNTVVTITGSHLTGTTAVTFGGTPAASFTVVSDNTVTATVNGGSTGSVALVINGVTYSLAGFTYRPVPTINSFSPSSTPQYNTVTITGAGFTTAQAVSFGGTAALSFNVMSDSVITAVVGNGASGSVSVTNLSGTGSAACFTITAMPPPGNALNFNGSNYISSPVNSLENRVTGSYTIEAWIRPTSSTKMGILSTSGGNVQQTFNLYMQGGTLYANIGNGAKYLNGTTPVGTFNFTAGLWHHIALVVSQTPSIYTCYIDGIIAGRGSLSGTSNIMQRPPLYIGQSAIAATGASQAGFIGDIDEVRVWNYAATPAQVQADMLNVVTGPANNNKLYLYYNFDQGAAGGNNSAINTIYDLSQVGINGTLNGFNLTGAASNWVESYAMAVPSANAATNITGAGFTANWTAPAVGIVNNYVLDVATDNAFSNVLAAYNALPVTGTSQVVTGLAQQTTYYYRVRADKASVTGVGAYSAAITATTTVIPPVITSFSPTSASAFDTVTVHGTGFLTASAVAFGGTSAGSFTATSDTSIVAVMTNGSTGSVSVTARGGQASLAGFTYINNLTAMAPPGNALSFDGVDDNVVIKNPLAGASSYTLEYWVRTTQTNSGSGQWYNGNGIVDGDIGGADYDLGTSLLGTKLAFGTGNPSSVGDATLVSHSNVNTGKWVFVAATRNANTGLMKLYINGVAEDSTVAGTTPLATNSTMTMGGANTGGSKFQGSIDEVRMFNTDRSANILADMADTLGRTAPSLAAYYNFDEGVAAGTNTGINLLFDQGASNITGTLNNFALTGSTSNWVESYAAVLPTTHPASDIYSTGFTASWATPYLGIAENYLLDVATDSAFTNIVAGYSALPVNGTYKTVKGLTLGNTYYYRVRAEKASVTGQGAYSGIIRVTTAPAAPVINSFTPTSATTAGAAITIFGTSFAGATAVSFGGNPATSFTVVSDNLVTAVLGAGATGSVSVTTPVGTATKAGFVFGQPTSSTTLVAICASALPYRWNGADYNAPGSYTIHLANAAGSDSSATLVLTVNQPTTSTTQAAVCASALPYNWNGNNYNVAGSYTVHLTNTADCDSAATLVLTVTQPTSSSKTVNICASAFPYRWNGTNYNAAGSYTVHLTNAAGCDSAATLVLNVSQAAPLTAKAYPSAASSCGNGSDGRISIGTTGGVWPVMFILTKPDGTTITQRNNYTFNGLTAGTYNIKATDTAGCTATVAGVAVVQPAPLTAKAYPSAASSCGNGSDGRISIGTTGGVWPVMFMLTKPDGTTITQRNNYIFNGLTPGTYNINATDTAGCTATVAGVAVVQGAPLTAKAYPSAASSCGNGSDGRISIGTTGGVWPVMFMLTKPDGTTITQRNNYIFNGLTPGTYNINATDTAGCTATVAGVAVVQGAPLTAKAYPSAASSCGNGSDGRISIGTTGGVWPVMFMLTKPDGTTITQRNNYIFNGLTAGTYNINATDTAGCTATIAGVAVVQGAPLTAKAYPSAASSCGNGSDGRISIGTTGGVWPVMFMLTKPDGTTITQRNNYIFNGLAAGTYNINATDTSGCTATATGVVVNNAGGPCSSIAAPGSKAANPKSAKAESNTLKIKVLPNPTVTNFTLTLQGGDDKKVAELIVMDMAGRIVYHTVGSVFGSYTFGQTFANGMYMAEVLNGNKVARIKLVKGN